MRTHQDLFDREMRLYDQETLTQQLDEFQRYLRETEKLGYQSLDPAKPGKSQDLEKERRERSRDFEKEGAEQRRIAGEDPVLCEFVFEVNASKDAQRPPMRAIG